MNLPDDLLFCPACACPIQRTDDVPDSGMTAHWRVVHPTTPAARPERNLR